MSIELLAALLLPIGIALTGIFILYSGLCNAVKIALSGQQTQRVVFVDPAGVMTNGESLQWVEALIQQDVRTFGSRFLRDTRAHEATVVVKLRREPGRIAGTYAIATEVVGTIDGQEVAL